MTSDINWDETSISDVAPDDDFGAIPDHTASRDERRSFLSYLTPKRDEEAPKRGRRPTKRKKPASRPKQGAFVDPLMQMYGLVGVSVMMKDEHCGEIILQNAEKCARAVDELAYQNESVRRVLDALVTTSAFGAVVMAHAPIIVAVAAHHGGGKLPFIPKFEETPEAA